ncbi:MAG TPA: hypothetical protein VE441_17165 [Mycobacterium sp.]|nr:hypothetical protein [Mycobacterium sp.]
MTANDRYTSPMARSAALAPVDARRDFLGPPAVIGIGAKVGSAHRLSSGATS